MTKSDQEHLFHLNLNKITQIRYFLKKIIVAQAYILFNIIRKVQIYFGNEIDTLVPNR